MHKDVRQPIFYVGSGAARAGGGVMRAVAISSWGGGELRRRALRRCALQPVAGERQGGATLGVR